VLELWGIGDVALAVPFLREASRQTEVTLLAKPHAGPIVRHFAPDVHHVPLEAPWTAFTGKYRLLRWPWRTIHRALSLLRVARFDHGLSARPDPRDHALLRLAGVRRRMGYPRAGSGCLLHETPAPPGPHRADHWAGLAKALGWTIAPSAPAPRQGRRIALHPGAGNAVREWPFERFARLAENLGREGWEVRWLDPKSPDLAQLIRTLDACDRFIGNDSGPGHLAALLGLPTFTIFGPQLPERFAPRHPQASWIEGAACAYRPCSDRCHYTEARCLTARSAAEVWQAITPWLNGKPA
jgi:ADP-heptose:LPS heptosyltransferase